MCVRKLFLSVFRLKSFFFNYSEKTILLISISFVLFSFQRTTFERLINLSKLNKNSNITKR